MSTDTDPRQIEIWRKMSMQQKLDLIIQLHDPSSSRPHGFASSTRSTTKT
jgi:hypothetical protein